MLGSMNSDDKALDVAAEKSEPKTYSKPEVTELGKLEELTQKLGTGLKHDVLSML